MQSFDYLREQREILRFAHFNLMWLKWNLSGSNAETQRSCIKKAFPGVSTEFGL